MDYRISAKRETEGFVRECARSMREVTWRDRILVVVGLVVLCLGDFFFLQNQFSYSGDMSFLESSVIALMITAVLMLLGRYAGQLLARSMKSGDASLRKRCKMGFVLCTFAILVVLALVTAFRIDAVNAMGRAQAEVQAAAQATGTVSSIAASSGAVETDPVLLVALLMGLLGGASFLSGLLTFELTDPSYEVKLRLLKARSLQDELAIEAAYAACVAEYDQTMPMSRRFAAAKSKERGLGDFDLHTGVLDLMTDMGDDREVLKVLREQAGEREQVHGQRNAYRDDRQERSAA